MATLTARERDVVRCIAREMTTAQAAGELAIAIDDTTFRLREVEAELAAHAEDIAAFRARQHAAFAAERAAWAGAGEAGASTDGSAR